MPRFKPSKSQQKSRKNQDTDADSVDDRVRHEQRSMRLNDVFDNFRCEIEGATPDCTIGHKQGLLRPSRPLHKSPLFFLQSQYHLSS